MLLAVEGGGFFSSSASGYSKGLSLLLLGQKSEEKPMRVAPWSHYQLVNQETGTNLELASRKNRLIRGCARSFVCFGRAATGLESPSHLKVGPTQQQELSPASRLEKREDIDSASGVVEDKNASLNPGLKSSLKKPANSIAHCRDSACDCEAESDAVDDLAGRKVQWSDTSGGELFEVREFELSDDGETYDEYDRGNEKTCLCKIM